jgi:hypothetical protein
VRPVLGNVIVRISQQKDIYALRSHLGLGQFLKCSENGRANHSVSRGPNEIWVMRLNSRDSSLLIAKFRKESLSPLLHCLQCLS